MVLCLPLFLSLLLLETVSREACGLGYTPDEGALRICVSVCLPVLGLQAYADMPGCLPGSLGSKNKCSYTPTHLPSPSNLLHLNSGI